jgi:hypothetical protein
MLSIAGTLGLMVLIITMGKTRKEIHPLSYFFIAVLALLQVCIVLYDMYTMAKPAL